MHPDILGNRAQRLAEATIAPGIRTRWPCHRNTEEIYHFLRGRRTPQIDDGRLKAKPGDTVLIPSGRWHRVINAGAEDLVFLCGCSPADAHADTERPTSVPGGVG